MDSLRPRNRDQCAPTRWGHVDYHLTAKGPNHLLATVDLQSSKAAPADLHVKFRLPTGKSIQSITVDGNPVEITGPHKDTAAIYRPEEHTLTPRVFPLVSD
jgi:hypothetical protein